MFKWMLKKPQVKILNKKSIVYLMNDPGTPSLLKQIPEQPQLSPSYRVKDYNGGGYLLNSKGGRAAQVFTVITETLKWVHKYAPHKLPNWATGLPLIVEPEAGRDLNAYYYRKGIKFFYYDELYTALSSDVVAHELGHAIFDSYRPKSWNVQALELWSFHEAFADITSIITVLQNDEIIEALLKDNYLKKNNIVSRIGEEIGKAIYDITEGKDGRNPNYLRNAAIKYKYADPSTLPSRGKHDTISAESHSFGRIMLGALYMIFYKMYQHEVLRGSAHDEAIRDARDSLSKYLLKAIVMTPLNPNFYQSFARTMVWAADNEQYQQNHHKIIYRVFRLWKIIPKQNIKILATYDDIINIKGAEIIEEGLVKTGTVETVKLSEETGIGTLDHNPLYDVEIEIPMESMYFVNNQTVVGAETTRSDAIMCAKHCLDLLHQTNSVGDDETTPFEITNNKLIRTYID